MIAAMLPVVAFLLVMPSAGRAQDNRLINTHNWRYEYISRLQQRGYLLSLNPTDMPYTYGDIRDAIAEVDTTALNRREKRWYHALENSVPEKENNVGEMYAGGMFSLGVRHSSSKRLNVDQPLGKGKAVLPRASLRGYLEWEHWIAQGGLTFDWFYDIDPDGLDVARHLYTRSEEIYIGYHSKIIDVYAGRFDNQWGQYNRHGSFLTDNPRSFNQLQIKFGNPTISFSSIFGELGAMRPDGTFSGKAGDFKPDVYRRYLFLNRLDWSPASNFKITLMEGELYSDKTAGISLQSLLPLDVLYFSSQNAPQNYYINLGLGGSIWYQTGPLTFYLQGNLDEIELNKSKTERQKENNKYIPPAYALNSAITIADIGSFFDLSFEADAVSSNAYRTNHIWEQWTYAQRGLATNFSDYVRTKVYATFYPAWAPALKIEPGVTFYNKGEADMRERRSPRNADGTPIEAILSGTVERTVRPSLYFRYQPLHASLLGESGAAQFNFWFDADMGMNFIHNKDHVKGATDQRFIGLFRLFGQVTF